MSQFNLDALKKELVDKQPSGSGTFNNDVELFIDIMQNWTTLEDAKNLSMDDCLRLMDETEDIIDYLEKTSEVVSSLPSIFRQMQRVNVQKKKRLL